MTEADQLSFIASLLRNGDATPGEQRAASAKLQEIIVCVRRLEHCLDGIVQDAKEDALTSAWSCDIVQMRSAV